MLLDLQNISKSYLAGPRRIRVLYDINLQVDSGDYIAIMGTSGSGKSTLLHILGTLLRPDTGIYCLDGKEIQAKSDNELAWIRAHWLGYVFQTFDLIPEYSVRDNVALPYLYRGKTSKKEVQWQVDRAISLVGLAHRSTHKPNELSGGEMQRAAIARAVAIQPKLILADEPTGNLDEANSLEIMDIFENLNDLGSTIIMVTHDRHIANHSNKTLYMRDGRIVLDHA